MLTLYSMQSSGNSYKVRLLLARLQTRYKLVEIDILRGESRTADFLAKNPDGHVPLLGLENGKFLPESNAILVYLAEETPFLPADRFERAETLRWMFFEQHSHEPAIAAARWWLHLVKGGRELKTHDIDHWMEQGYQALMRNHMSIAEKDLAWVLALARQAGLALPVGGVVSQLMARLYNVDDPKRR